jgi:AcrR family transcriptional regulator
VCYLALGTGALLGVGVSVSSFSYHFRGLAGLAMRVLGQDPDRPVSVLSMARAFPLTAPDPTAPGILFLQATYLVFAVVAPLAAVAALLLHILGTAPIRRGCAMIFEVTETRCEARRLSCSLRFGHSRGPKLSSG